MAEPIPWLAGWMKRLDEDSLSVLYRRFGVRRDRILQRWRGLGLWPTRGEPSFEDRNFLAHRLVTRAASNGGFVGGVTGAGGLVTIPLEGSLFVVRVLRLAQELAVAWGFDPHDDRGRVVVARALADGFGVELPPQGTLGMTVRQLWESLWRRAEVKSLAGPVASAVVQSAGRLGGYKVRRLLPVLGVGTGATAHFQGISAVGQRMSESLKREARAQGLDRGEGITDAWIVE